MDPWLNTRTVHTHALTCTQAGFLASGRLALLSATSHKAETWPITVGFKSIPDQLLPENKSACPIGILSTQTDIPDVGLREISCLIRRSTCLLPNIHLHYFWAWRYEKSVHSVRHTAGLTAPGIFPAASHPVTNMEDTTRTSSTYVVPIPSGRSLQDWTIMESLLGPKLNPQ
jgi:hypothetical protein